MTLNKSALKALLVVLGLASCAQTADSPELVAINIPNRGLEQAWWERISVDDEEENEDHDRPIRSFTYRVPADVLFEPGSSVVGPNGEAVLTQLAQNELAEAVSVEIVGHTDSEGSEAYNLQLGLDRAESSRLVLVDQGVDEAIITTASNGETEPVAAETGGDADAARAQNRRIEIIVTIKRQTETP